MVFIFIFTLVASSIGCIIVYNLLKASMHASRERIQDEHKNLINDVARLEAERRDLNAEQATLERSLNELKYDIKEMQERKARKKAPLAKKNSPSDHDVGKYMLSQGMITLQQYTQVTRMTAQLKTDFASICLTLGYTTQAGVEEIKKHFST